MKSLAILLLCAFTGCVWHNNVPIREIGLEGTIPSHIPADATTTVALAKELERAWNYPGAKPTVGQADAKEISRVEFPKARNSARVYTYHPERRLVVQIWGDIDTPAAKEMVDIARQVALEKFGITLTQFQRLETFIGP